MDIDPGAVILNGYYCSYFREDMSITEMAFGVRCHYENSYDDIRSFIKYHEPGAFEETDGDFRGEEMRAAAAYLDRPIDYLFSVDNVARNPTNQLV